MIINAKNWRRKSLASEEKIQVKVAEIIATIQSRGDSAINAFSKKFDNQQPEFIELLPFEDYQLDSALAASIKSAAERIERFARFQFQGVETRYFEDEFGFYGQQVSPLERIGAYIPGGRYPLISTALMTLIPAKVAGCPIRIACSPSDNPAILAAASLAGATQFLKIGGVQAIGALTTGYQSLEPVDLIVGPGNAWVNEAKKQVQSRVKIDGLAGPSELLALCDNKQPIEWLALDALAQAEHDPMAISIIVSDSQSWLTDMLAYLENNEDTQLLLKNKQIELVFAENNEEMIGFSETFSPEHLMLCHAKISQKELSNFGSLFVGANSAVALGDYISGPNHTLPTLAYARQNGGLSINNYLKITTLQEINNFGRKLLSEQAAVLAKVEGLLFHEKSLKVRIES